MESSNLAKNTAMTIDLEYTVSSFSVSFPGIYRESRKSFRIVDCFIPQEKQPSEMFSYFRCVEHYNAYDKGCGCKKIDAR